jgi:hypothetical protein
MLKDHKKMLQLLVISIHTPSGSESRRPFCQHATRKKVKTIALSFRPCLQTTLFP